MNMQRLISMAVRMGLRRGMNAAIKRSARQNNPDRPQTPQDHAAARDARQTGQKARRSLQLLRRFMR